MTSFSKNSLITFLTQILVFVFGFLSLIIISRVLGPEGKGIYSLIILIPGMILAFGSLGLGSGNVYFVGSKKYKIEDVVSNSLILSLLLGFILIFGFWALLRLDFFKGIIGLNKIPLLYLWLVVLTIPLSLLLSFFQDIVRGKGDIKNYNKVSIIREIAQLVSVAIFLFLLQKGLLGAVVSHILTVALSAIFVFFLIKKISKITLSFNKKLLKDSIIYGGKVYFANIISLLNYRLDMFLIAFFLNPVSVGLYSIAVGIAERLFIIPGAFVTVLYPKVSSLDHSEANDLTPKVVRHTLFIMIISIFFLIVFSYPIINLVFGSAFLSAIAPLIILLPGIIAFGIGGVLAADLSGRGKPEFAVYSSSACLITNIILNIILIPKWGISGAAFASSVAYWIDTLIIIIAFLNISKKPLSEVLVIKANDFQDYFNIFLNFKNLVKKNYVGQKR